MPSWELGLDLVLDTLEPALRKRENLCRNNVRDLSRRRRADAVLVRCCRYNNSA